MSPRNFSRAQWPWRHTLTHAARAARRERGTVLLMVVGVLALLAIIGVVYATIGRADRSMSATTQKVQRLNDQAEEMAAYMAKVIGSATFAQYTEPTEGASPFNPGNSYRFRTRGFTYPRTDEHFLSFDPARYGAVAGPQNLPGLANANLYAPFSATGENLRPWLGNASDPREPSDPYLAVLEPEFLGTTGEPDLANASMFDMHDWRHISNFAPSGNFVNLANLRRSNNGGFNAPPGFQRGTGAVVAGMSYGLTLRNPSNGNMYTVGNSRLPDGTTLANPANPAHWSNDQVWAFRPAVPDATPTAYAPGDYEYVLNQWADTDGDGFLDARWFELTDIREMFGNTSAVVKQVVPARGRYRLVCAVRCIDNSGKINVNVASDMVDGPFPTPNFTSFNPNGSVKYLTRDDALPPGISPADIAINRVLRLSDVNVALDSFAPAGPVNYGYQGIPQPATNAWDRLTSDYSQYNKGANAVTRVGDAGYVALVDARQRGSTYVGGLGPNLPISYKTNAGERFQHYDLFAADPHAARASIAYGSTSATIGVTDQTKRVLRSPFDLADELELAAYFGVNDSDTLSRFEATIGAGAYVSTHPTFSPLRDNRPRSLEMTGRDELDGRAMFNQATGRQSLLAVFTDVRHLLTTVNGSRPLKDEAVAASTPGTDATTPSSIASTDVSAALKAIANFSRFDRAPRSTDPARASTPFNQPAKEDYDDFQRAAKLIFKLYANALAPYTEVNEFPSAWMTGAGGASRDGLVYGGNAELALRMAAHMTANLIDAFDRDRTLDGSTTAKGRPNQTDRNDNTSIMLQLAASPSSTATTFPEYTPNHSLKRAYSGGAVANLNEGIADPGIPGTTPSRLPPLPANIPSHTQYPNSPGKMTIFGVEAQPFLTEVGTMALHTDAPNSAGGGADVDWNDAPTGPGPSPGLLAPPTQDITIRLDPDLGKSDFLCEVIAFQLHNPFEQDIVLYDPRGGDPLKRNKFYIEFCARYYSFGKQDENVIGFDPAAISSASLPLVLKAGRTQTFYTINPGTLKAAGQRLKDINEHSNNRNMAWNTDDDYTAAIKNWIEKQLQAAGADLPMQLTQINPETFNAILNPNPMPDMDIWGQNGSALGLDNVTTPPHSNAEMRVCQLWKTVRSKSSLYASNLPGGAVSDETGNENDTTNDYLADRLHDPSDAATHAQGYLFDVRNDFGSTNHDITGATGGDEEGPSGGVEENTGYSAIVWASIRRPTDVKQTTAGTPGGTLDAGGTPRQIRGILPPWCLEARSDAKTTLTGNKYLNKTFRTFTSVGGKNDYTSAGPERFKTLTQAINAASAANPEIGKPCFKKGQTGGQNLIGKTRDDVAARQREYSEVAVEFHSVGEDIYGGPEVPDNGTAPSGAAIRRSRNPMLFSRAGDFLLPLAIGPWFDPSRRGTDLVNVSSNAGAWLGSAGAGVIAGDREAAWMTLSEALALSCGYYSPQDPADPLFQFGMHAAANGSNSAHVPKADRGHLVLNAFTPYLQLAGGNPQPLGSGVPFALGIIDQFRAAVGISSTPKLIRPDVADQVAPEQQTRATAFGGGTTNLATNQSVAYLNRREGFMNINTLTLNGLRTLPLIAPEDDANSWTRLSSPYYNTAANNPALFDFAGNSIFDLAPTIKAYRDLSREEYRHIGTAMAQSNVDFSPGTNPMARLELPQAPGTLGVTLDTYRRTGRGIKSMGELAAVNIATVVTNPTSQSVSVDRNSMFRFSAPDVVSGTLGASTRNGQRSAFTPVIFSSNFFNLETVKGEPDKTGAKTVGSASGAPIYAMGDNELPNGYQQKLAIINALTNTASVRSDVFTVYFVIHGYTPEDCDVETEQPLVPSVAKRFVMVVDRSNMLSPSDKPRILMLKEVPMQ